MRCLMKVTIPVVEGNAAISDGSFGLTISSILADLKPEAAYFAAENGQRTAFLFINMENSSQLPAMAEPFFQSFGASIEVTPPKSQEHLKKAGPGNENAVKKYSRAARAASA